MVQGIRLSTINISATSSARLARFYADLLGWRVREEEPGWVLIEDPSDPRGVRIAFEQDIRFEPPVWPTEPGRHPIQQHLEIAVTNLEEALHHALECGARSAEVQPQDDVRVCIDPDGHPFCLWLDEG